MKLRIKLFYSIFLKLILILLNIFSIFLLFNLLIDISSTFAPDFKIHNSIVILIIFSIIVLAITCVMTVREYKQKFLFKRIENSGRSYLSMEDVFENENRINIIKHVIDKPGIHHNELMRVCDLQKGQLQWHLDILIKNQIIKKTVQGQYALYFPNLKSFELPPSIKKGIIRNSTTHNILEIIKENPGINPTLIAKKVNLAKNTINYHLDKLLEADMIYTKKNGRRKEIFYNLLD